VEVTLPVPPDDLVYLVAGTPDVDWFLEGGRLAVESIVETLEKNGIDLAAMESVLDFGCGCGRVMRHWPQHKSNGLYGCDYNPALIEWCEQNLGFATYNLNQLDPPLDFSDASFDLVYMLSIITHLSKSLQRVWMKELYRILKPGGYAIITTHGEYFCDEEMNPEEIREFRRGRLVVRNDTSSGENHCCTFHPESYVRNTLAKGFDVIDFIPQGARGNPPQDLYLIRKKTTGSSGLKGFLGFLRK
jgi:SAM-dependent methyltransferase